MSQANWRSLLVGTVLRASVCVLQPSVAFADENARCSTAELCPSQDFPQFCNFENGEDGLCQSCVNVTHPADCFDLGVPLGGLGGKDCAETCLPHLKLGCSMTTDSCVPGYSFCAFSFGGTGNCAYCPFSNVDECRRMNLTDLGLESCVSSCKVYCQTHIEAYWLLLDDGTSVFGWELKGSPVLNVSAPLVECTQLTVEDVSICAEDAENSICLVDMKEKYEEPRIPFYEMVWKAEKSGCAIVAFFIEGRPQDSIKYYIEGQKTSISIPSLSITGDAGRALINNKLGTSAEIKMYPYEYCAEGCTELWPCSSSDWYCDYKLEDFGVCSSCEYDGACFFRGLPECGIQECMNVCGASPKLTFPNCKFCPKDVSGSNLGSADEETTCRFCPENDMKYKN